MSPAPSRARIPFNSRTIHARLATALLAILAFNVASFTQTVILQNAFPSLTFPAPVDVQHAGDGTDRLFVVRQAGVITVVSGTSPTATARTFLDIDSSVESGGERGLLGLAFHPAYESNGYFYVNYTAGSPLRTVVSRFTVSAANPDSADRASESILLEVLQPYANHNGGQLAFGPDGYLYVAMGDGGSGGDPENRAQDRTTLLGKILRIDVNAPSDTLEYSIPPDNPYAGNVEGHREEIYAYGLRNPWRLSFDAATGTGWIGDVGQGEWEEVDILAPGANYGWRFKEGTHCYNPSTGCDTIAGLTDPVWEYAHDGSGGCSITGGYVYRGADIPSLAGKYLFGDYCSGRIWALDTNGLGEWNAALVLDTTRNITSFGVDRDGEVYVCSPGDSRIYRLVTVSPLVPVLRSPDDGASNVPADTTITWFSSASAVAYQLQVAADAGFTSLHFNDSTLADTSYYVQGLPGGQQFHWRVRAKNSVGWSVFSPARTFTTASAGGGSVVGYAAGWNIVALPRNVADGTADSVLPGAISPAFAYVPGAGYAGRDSLVPGAGYWVKFPGPQLASFDGAERTLDTIAVGPGWNLIGGLSDPVDVDSVETIPPGITASGFYGYQGSYYRAASLDPGKGYWVKIASSGFVVLRRGE